MKIQHIVITRFNLRMREFKQDKNGNPMLHQGWLNDRFPMFEKYCMPSMQNQSSSDFTWLVLIDEDSSAEVFDRFEGYHRRWANLVPVRMPFVGDDSQLAEVVRGHVSSETTMLLTTRLDSDDALCGDAFEQLRKRIRPGVMEFLSFRFGYIHDGQMAHIKSHRYSQFVSLAEPRRDEPFVTVHCGKGHGRVRQVAPVKQIKDRPYWLEAVHSRNVANLAFGEIRKYDLSRPREVPKWIKARFLRPLRARFWPRDYRRPRRMDELASTFNFRPR